MKPSNEFFGNTFMLFGGLLAFMYLFKAIENPTVWNIGITVFLASLPVLTLLEYAIEWRKEFKKWNSKTK